MTPISTPVDWSPVLVDLDLALMAVIEPWFDHPTVKQWLGGREWIVDEYHRALEGPGTTFRGKRVLRSYKWVALDPKCKPIAFIGGDVTDCWTRSDLDDDGKPEVVEVDHRKSMGLAYVVDPAQHSRGVCRSVLQAAVEHRCVSDVEVFYCGIDSDNRASLRCCAAAGFTAISTEPNWEDVLYYRLVV